MIINMQLFIHFISVLQIFQLLNITHIHIFLNDFIKRFSMKFFSEMVISIKASIL